MKVSPKEESSESARLQPLGRYLIRLFSEFEQELLSALHKTKEYSSITAADHQILRCISREGNSIVEIAELTGTTKQAVSKAVASLEKRGFLLKKPDVYDGRAQVVTFSAKGLQLFSEGMRIVGGIEKKYARIIGSTELERIKRGLMALIETYEKKEK